MIDSQWFSLTPTPLAILFGIGLLVACLVLSWIGLQRTGFKRSMVFLELVRILLVSMVALAMCQPEWLQKFLPSTEPVLAILWDQSDSMNSEDIASETGNLNSATISRRQSIESLIDHQAWQQVATDRPAPLKIAIEPFSSSLASPTSGSDLNLALTKVMEKNENLRAVVMISDGSWNIGNSPTEAATQLRMKDIPVYTIVVGSETALPDLEVDSLEAPTFGVVNKPTRIPFSITSTLPRDAEVTVNLSSTAGDDVTGKFTVPANGTLQQAFVWSPKKVGEYILTIDVPAAEGERILANNTLSAPISIRQESLKVLVVDSYPRWEYRYLRNALSRDPGVDVACLLFHPDTGNVGGGKDYIDQFPESLEELAKFDVIFLGDVGVGDGQLTVQDCQHIKGLVENQATGLILMPGLRGRQLSLVETDLADLFPIVFDSAQPRGWGNRVPAKFQLTEAGSQSLLTKLADSPEANLSVWRSLPGFQWYAPVLRAKVGTQVLAVHSSESNAEGRIPLLVTKTFGAGKVLFMGTDGAWRWREGVEDKYHYRFWGQVARWMAYQRNMAGGESMRLFYSPDRPRTGQTLSLNANVMAIDGEPLQSGNVNLQIIAPSGDTQTIKLAPQTEDGQWGLFAGFFVPVEPGEHQATLNCQETGTSLTATISVQGLQRERLGRPANVGSLQEIAAITHGKMVNTSQLSEILNAIRELPEPESQIRRIRIWAHPAWAGTIIGLLGLFWVGRKLVGVI